MKAGNYIVALDFEGTLQTRLSPTEYKRVCGNPRIWQKGTQGRIFNDDTVSKNKANQYLGNIYSLPRPSD